jgi:hypothetical protein
MRRLYGKTDNEKRREPAKTPSSRHQAPNKSQVPNSKKSGRSLGALVFVIWSLFGIWDLAFGVLRLRTHLAALMF